MMLEFNTCSLVYYNKTWFINRLRASVSDAIMVSYYMLQYSSTDKNSDVDTCAKHSRKQLALNTMLTQYCNIPVSGKH